MFIFYVTIWWCYLLLLMVGGAWQCRKVRWWKCSFIIIFEDTPAVNDSTWSLMYSINASLSHLPTLWIINVATPARNIAIAPPDRIEWSPTSSFVNPNVSFPNSSTIPLNFALAYAESMYRVCPLSVYAHTFVSSFARGTVFNMRVIVYAQALTGHNMSYLF